MTETIALIVKFLNEHGYHCRVDGSAINVRAKITRRIGEVTSTDDFGPKTWYKIASIGIEGVEITIRNFFNRKWQNTGYHADLHHPNSLPGLLQVLAKITKETDDLHKNAKFIHWQWQ